MTVLVTGATGFLGGHVLHALRRQSPHGAAAVLVRSARTWHDAAHSKHAGAVQVIEGELTDVSAVIKALGGQTLTGILHLAAVVHHSRSDAAKTHRANVVGTGAMVDLAQKTGARLVFVSTSGTVGCHRQASYSPNEHAPHCSAAVRHWPYYVSKIAAEKLILKAVQQKQLDAVILRPPVMLGPNDARFRATSLLVRFLRGRVPFYLGGGMHFIDVRDAAEAVAAALHHRAPRPVYNLPGAAMSLKNYFQAVGDLSGVKAPKLLLPYPVAHAFARVTGGRIFDPVVIEMGRHHWGLSSLYAQELGFSPRSEYETLTETVAWLRDVHPALR